MKKTIFAIAPMIAGLAFTSFAFTAAGAAPLPEAKPDDVGFSQTGLARMDDFFAREIAAKHVPGAVVAVARDGKLVLYKAYGKLDPTKDTPMPLDAVFALASMTKPMATVAGLTLMEQGRLPLQSKLADYYPGFAGMKVAVPQADGSIKLEAQKSPIHIHDLYRHTSGLIYGGRGNSVVHKMYPAGSGDAARDYDGAAFLDKLATLPLLWQPATVWDYGFGLDVLGLTIEKVSGKPLGQYLQANLWGPLGMTDTGFAISPDKAARYAKPLPTDPDTGKPQARSPELTQPLKFDCGGGCAASTASDYLRFAEMLMNGGRFGEARLLGSRTVAYMLSDQLGPNIKNLVGNADPTRADYGFGLGLAVRATPGVVRMMGSVGQFSWPGASGTDWWADPKEDLVVVYLSAAPGPLRWHYRQKINALVYQAIME